MYRHHFSRQCRDQSRAGSVLPFRSRILLYIVIRRVVSLLHVPPGRLSELVSMAEKMKFESDVDGNRVLSFVDEGGDLLEVAIDPAYDPDHQRRVCRPVARTGVAAYRGYHQRDRPRELPEVVGSTKNRPGRNSERLPSHSFCGPRVAGKSTHSIVDPVRESLLCCWEHV